MLPLIILLAVLALIVLISWAKVDTFLAFLLVTIPTGLALGLGPLRVLAAVQKGLGDTLASVALVVVLGAMLGRLVADSGAAGVVADTLLGAGGRRAAPWLLLGTGFVVGVPLFYNVGFLLLLPLVYAVATRYRLPAVALGLPMLAALSALHGFLPPHPAPSALVAQLGADMGRTFLYGLVVATPAVLLAGPVFARTLRRLVAHPPPGFGEVPEVTSERPGPLNSFASALLPVGVVAVVLALRAALPAGGALGPALAFLAAPEVVLLVAVLVASYSLGLAQGRGRAQVAATLAGAVREVAPILLIIGGAGALKEVLQASGASATLAAGLTGTGLPPLLLGWLLAAGIRVALGSATVAGLTAASVMLPLVQHTTTNANLLVLSIGAGSLFLSHLNDGGFWLFKEYFGLSVKDTLRSWSLMECILSVTGLLMVLALDWIV